MTPVELLEQPTLSVESPKPLGPKIIVDEIFPFIHPDQNVVADLFRSYAMSETKMAEWTIELKQTPKDPKSKERGIWGRIQKKKKLLQLYPETIGSEYYEVVPEFRKAVSETDMTSLRRRHRRKIESKQEKIKEIPEKSESEEKNAENIQLLLNITLHDLVDDIFHKDKRMNTRSVIRSGTIIGRIALFGKLFLIFPPLAIGSAFTILPIISRRILQLTDQQQSERRKKRIQERKEIIIHPIRVRVPSEE